MRDTGDIELTNFEGEQLADQYIDSLYQFTWRAWNTPPFFVNDDILSKGFERWKNEDRNSPFPLFYKSVHTLWSNVPDDARIRVAEVNPLQ